VTPAPDWLGDSGRGLSDSPVAILRGRYGKLTKLSVVSGRWHLVQHSQNNQRQ